MPTDYAPQTIALGAFALGIYALFMPGHHPVAGTVAVLCGLGSVLHGVRQWLEIRDAEKKERDGT